MTRFSLAFVVALAASGGSDAAAQITLDQQDLAAATVASGLPQAGDFAIDGSGNHWILTTQGPIGGTGGFISRVTAAGVYTANVVNALAEVGQIVRGNDGAVYFWMVQGANGSSLCRLPPTGILLTITQIYNGYISAGIAIDALGTYYMGLKNSVTGGNVGIWRLPQGSTILSFHANGIVGQDQRYMAFDGTGILFVASGTQVRRIDAPPNLSTLVYTAPAGATITDLERGFYDDMLVTLSTAQGRSLVAIKPGGGSTRVAGFPASTGPAPAVALGLAASGFPEYRTLNQGALTRIGGFPSLLFSSVPAPLQVRLDQSSPGGPMFLCVDVPGYNLSVPGWGVFHTSLGTGPFFWAILDPIGIWTPPSPFAVSPFTFTFTLPAPAGVTIAVETYTINSLAGNGQGVMISNFLSLSL